jgi:hypothetical protein
MVSTCSLANNFMRKHFNRAVRQRSNCFSNLVSSIEKRLKTLLADMIYWEHKSLFQRSLSKAIWPFSCANSLKPHIFIKCRHPYRHITYDDICADVRCSVRVSDWHNSTSACTKTLRLCMCFAMAKRMNEAGFQVSLTRFKTLSSMYVVWSVSMHWGLGLGDGLRLLYLPSWGFFCVLTMLKNSRHLETRHCQLFDAESSRKRRSFMLCIIKVVWTTYILYLPTVATTVQHKPVSCK